jgi:hypothetical protein
VQQDQVDRIQGEELPGFPDTVALEQVDPERPSQVQGQMLEEQERGLMGHHHQVSSYKNLFRSGTEFGRYLTYLNVFQSNENVNC